MVVPIGESANILNFPPIQPTLQPNPTLNYDTNGYPNDDSYHDLAK